MPHTHSERASPGPARIARWGLATGLLVLTATTAANGRAAGQPLVVRTKTGLVAGVPTATGVSYKGLPYAAAPVGDLRWRSPQRANAWTGVRKADNYGPPCAQAPLRGRTEVSSLSREDCLYLNVWTPHPGSKSKLPVMVWIHGGGFENGSGSSLTYDGTALSAKGVIVVTINYRLGVFGFLAHPELTAASAHKSSGNFGLEDQLAGLRWVSENIAAFGGDPANVTLFGQSAGGASVLDLMGSPQTKRLVKRFIIESGAARAAISPSPMSTAEQRGLTFAGGTPIGDLRRLDVEAVLKRAEMAASSGVRFGPVMDGYLITGDPGEKLADQRGSKTALLIGNNSREGLNTPSSSQIAGAIRAAFGANAENALRFYGLEDGGIGQADALLGSPAQQFATDSTFRCGSAEIAQLNAAGGTPTWQYQFEQFVPGKEAQGAAHSFEVPYVFGNLSATGFSAADYGPPDRRLSDLMVSYWTNFAKRGDPNGPGLPAWPRYTTNEKGYLRLSAALPENAQAARDLRGNICRLFPRSTQSQ